MGQINRIPLGWLNMLQSQTGGRNPFEASETVAPTTEMVPFYHAQNMDVLQTTFSNAVSNTQGLIEVPEGNAIFLYAAAARLSAATAATGVLDIALSLRELPKGIPNAIAEISHLGRSNAAAVGDRLVVSQIFPQPLPLVSGTVMRFTNLTTDGNADTVTCYVTFASFKS